MLIIWRLHCSYIHQNMYQQIIILGFAFFIIIWWVLNPIFLSFIFHLYRSLFRNLFPQSSYHTLVWVSCYSLSACFVAHITLRVGAWWSQIMKHAIIKFPVLLLCFYRCIFSFVLCFRALIVHALSSDTETCTEVHAHTDHWWNLL
jgi:hypothetical protein